MTFILTFLTLLGASASAQAQTAEKNCFYAQNTYLVVDGSGQNMVLMLEGEECKSLNVTYGPRGSGSITFSVETGGWKPLPKIGGPLPLEPKGEYELIWEERKITLNTRGEREEGVYCTSTMSFGYDSYVPEESSFKLKSVIECTGEEKTESEVTLYTF